MQFNLFYFCGITPHDATESVAMQDCNPQSLTSPSYNLYMVGCSAWYTYFSIWSPLSQDSADHIDKSIKSQSKYSSLIEFQTASHTYLYNTQILFCSGIPDRNFHSTNSIRKGTSKGPVVWERIQFKMEYLSIQKVELV